MIAPERWYEQQKKYQKYGIDMRPQEQPRRRMRTQRKRKRVTLPVGNGKKVAMSTVLLVGAAMIVLIVITAYSANLRYNINSMINENSELMGEIENLEVRLYSANNVDYIETKATGELGMTYSQEGNRVYITSEDIPAEGFADIIKEKAYK